MTRKRRWVWGVSCVLAGWSAIATAQTVYKWTDEQGVVHFADLPPAHTKDVEERYLPARPAEEPPAAAPGDEPSTAEVGEAAPKAPAAEGPARVVVETRQTPRTGPSAMHIIGKVKNVGGTDAKGVAVTITAVDTTQGTPCLREEAGVAPSTLRPGESGNFDTDIDSPCLYGEPNVDVTPLWE
jgi:hypothetical protein